MKGVIEIQNDRLRGRETEQTDRRKEREDRWSGAPQTKLALFKINLGYELFYVSSAPCGKRPNQTDF